MRLCNSDCWLERLLEVEDTGETLRCRGSALASAATAEPSGEKDSWVFACFRQRYEGRVEIDAEGRTRTVPLPNPMKEEQLHLALTTDGRHWEPLNGNRPVWNQWLRDPYLARTSDGLWHLLATGGRPASRGGQTNLGPTCLYATSRTTDGLGALCGLDPGFHRFPQPLSTGASRTGCSVQRATVRVFLAWIRTRLRGGGDGDHDLPPAPFSFYAPRGFAVHLLRGCWIVAVCRFDPVQPEVMSEHNVTKTIWRNPLERTDEPRA
jgi:hypothetical protein